MTAVLASMHGQSFCTNDTTLEFSIWKPPSPHFKFFFLWFIPFYASTEDTKTKHHICIGLDSQAKPALLSLTQTFPSLSPLISPSLCTLQAPLVSLWPAPKLYWDLLWGSAQTAIPISETPVSLGPKTLQAHPHSSTTKLWHENTEWRNGKALLLPSLLCESLWEPQTKWRGWDRRFLYPPAYCSCSHSSFPGSDLKPME